MQLALHVADIEPAVEFYSKLFGSEPAKVRPGYANVALANPPLKLVLMEDASQGPGSVNHQLETTHEVADEKARLAEAGLVATVEGQVTCCYALQDKIWVQGPGGEPWELYTVLADTEAPAGRHDGSGDAGCCVTRPDLAGAAPASSSR